MYAYPRATSSSRGASSNEGERREKAAKTHQAQRIALDERTIVILKEHRARCEAGAKTCGAMIRSNGYVFSLAVDGSESALPDSITQRIHRLSNRLGVCVTLRGLRHYAATQMLTGELDLRTAAGRLGHSDGGTTTLRVYTHSCPPPINGRPNSSRGPSRIRSRTRSRVPSFAKPSGRTQWACRLTRAGTAYARSVH
jgi:hypothetical protein